MALATRSHLLREGLGDALAHQAAHNQQGKLFGLYGAFRVQVFHDLELDEFADAFAQMLAYGLFLARLNTDQIITLDNARQFVPGAFPLIRELIDFIGELHNPDYGPIRWLVEEILSIMNGIDLTAIRTDLSFSNRKAVRRAVRAGSEQEHRLFERDPFVYFYEDFLAKYDAKLRKARGVYYTPPPVVNFIIRAIDDVLRSSFGIADGLADHRRVTLLDFATGTGTFLLEALERMFETIGPSEAKRELLIREHVLKNVFGFEYLIAPYTIAHLKLSQYLKDKGFTFSGAERLRVYLTNTLEPIAPQDNWLLPALSAEATAAQTVKDQPILVITGNPPYSGHSKNKGKWIARAIDAYKIVDGKPLGERNPKWLNDDYVKFIRFAQMKIDAVPEGMIGIITNHSFLDNPTFRGMRQSLMTSFDQIFVLDLHGNAKKKETAPDGSKDENVFDIEQGVAISLFIKTRKPKAHKVFRADLYGPRLTKYEACARTAFNAIDWREVVPTTPFYLFETGDIVREAEYRFGPSVVDIFPVNTLGFQTHRDDFAIAFTLEEMTARIGDIQNAAISDAEILEKYGISDNKDWQLTASRAKIRSKVAFEIDCVGYRPFDYRYCLFGYETMDRPRQDLINHVYKKNNTCLLVPRQIGTAIWCHVFVADNPANDCLISNRSREANQVLPLYLYPAEDRERRTRHDLFDVDDPFAGQEKIENIAATYRNQLAVRYGDPAFTPEQIFGYVYAILHARTYRARFAEFLRGDFPRIPFTDERRDLETLADLGWSLAQIHLMKTLPRSNLGQYRGKGDNSVEKPRYAEAEQALYINAAQNFAPIPLAIWEFQIGGYQVLDKYLKSRKGRKLTLDEVTQVERIVAALEATLISMATIDAAYRTAFAGEAA
ncbi:MAG: N-6 DNA methylase [Acidiphilium sp.]|nr:N-6 DNA methylase [Acidiphilium sp.]MDD4934316.1 N-6 DNA methylase [Acidiphilium sp.]